MPATTDDLGRLRSRIRSHADGMIAALQGLTAFASINPPAEDGNHLSEGTRGALDFVVQHAAGLGLTARNLDQQTGYVEIGPADAPETVGVVAHLDVVPAGEGWTHPPFAGVVQDGLIWGRGVEDDKGPAISALYALKALNELGLPLMRRVRLILGTHEESGAWTDIAHYRSLEGTPTMGFTPDGTFPVICGEKGLISVDLRAAGPALQAAGRFRVLAWHAGAAANIVPARAWAALQARGAAAEARVELEATCRRFEADHPDAVLELLLPAEFAGTYPREAAPACDFVLVAQGMEAHGAQPWVGHNALVDLAGILARLDLVPDGHGRLARFVAERISGWDGADLGLAQRDDKLGPTTVNAGLARTAGEGGSVALNIRPTPGQAVESVSEALRAAAAPYGIEVVPDPVSMPPLFVDEFDPLVEALKSAYTEVTGQPAECLYVGGTTYAKAFPRCVAFGPLMPGEEMLAHQVDERVSVESIIRNAEIYALALYRLAGQP